MKLNLDFILYEGKTRLRAWWKAVKRHFAEVQDAVNELDDELKNEETARKSAVTAEETARKAAVTAEETARKAADNTLQQKIEAEAMARSKKDNELSGRIDEEITNRAISEKDIRDTFSGAIRRLEKADTDISEAVQAVSEETEAIGEDVDKLKLTAQRYHDFGSVSPFGDSISGEMPDKPIAYGDIVRFKATSDMSFTAFGFLYGANSQGTRVRYRMNVDNLECLKGQEYIAIVTIAPAENEDTGALSDGRMYVLFSGGKLIAAEQLAAEESARISAVQRLEAAESAESAERDRVDTAIMQNLTDEIAARDAADRELKRSIDALEEIAHTHENKSVIDGITAEQIERWNGFEIQVTQEQLAEAVSAEAEKRIDGDEGNRIYTEYIYGIAIGHERELHILYTLMGINHYSGSLFGASYDDDDLDGGEFDDDPEAYFDCGTWDDADIIDGGDYLNINGTVIDGGDYSNVSGVVIDGGKY